MVLFRIMGILVVSFVWLPPLFSRDVILEFKGAYFLPTHCMFKKCFKGGALYGPELTFQLRDESSWYGFASVDYYKQKGRFLSLCDSSTLRLVPLGLGIKYFVPCRTRADFYLGLGLQAAYLNKKSRNGCVTSKMKLWGFGGIAKSGVYIDLAHDLLLDLFIDYSFIRTKKNNFYGNKVTCSRTHVDGPIFGAGLGYRF